MLRGGDPRLLHRATNRSDATLLGGDDLVHRRPAARGGGAVEGGVPRARNDAGRCCRGVAGAQPRQRARLAVHRARALAGPVPLPLAPRPDATRLCVPAGGLYRQHHWLPIGRRAGRNFHDCHPARAGNHDRDPVCQPDPWAAVPPHRDGDVGSADRCDPGGCGTLVARFARRGTGGRARRRPAAARHRYQRTAPIVRPSAIRHRATAAAGCARCARCRRNCR